MPTFAMIIQALGSTLDFRGCFFARSGKVAARWAEAGQVQPRPTHLGPLLQLDNILQYAKVLGWTWHDSPTTECIYPASLKRFTEQDWSAHIVLSICLAPVDGWVHGSSSISTNFVS